MTVGERIKEKRLEMNLSQDELAKKVGYKSRSSIQKIECARDLPLKKVTKMASALNCTPSYLMGWEDFVDDVQHGQVDLDDLSHALHMYELYKKSTPKVQSMVEYLLDEGNSSKASQQD